MRYIWKILFAYVLNGTRCVERLVSGTDVVLFAPFDNLAWGKVPNKVHPQNGLFVAVRKCFDPVSDISHDLPRDVAEGVVVSALLQSITNLSRFLMVSCCAKKIALCFNNV